MGQSSPAQPDEISNVAAIRAELERERKVTASLLRLIASGLSLQEMMQEATLLLRDWTGCEAVGIRLAQGDDFPYFETRGFPPEFVAEENFLCDHDQRGEVQRDAAGNPLLECTCGNVLRGRLDPKHPNCTPGGSYWTNRTSQRRAVPVVPDTRHHPRNRCRDAGYESVALIPLRSGDVTYGLLQLNDKRPDCFSLDQIQRLEELARALAEAVARRRAMDDAREMQQRLRKNESLLAVERDLATLLGRVHTVDEALEPSLWAALTASQMEAGGIYLLDDAQQLLRLACHHGVSDEFAQTAREYTWNTAQARLVSMGELLELSGDVLQRPEFARAHAEGFQTVVVIPVSHEGRPVATVNLGSKRAFKLSSQMRNTLTVIASLLGATLARLHAADALRRSQSGLRAVYDHSPIMMCVLDAERQILSVNHAMSAFFGKPESALRLKKAGELLHCAGVWQDPRGCGFGESCQSCPLRLSINRTLSTGETCHNIERRMRLTREGRTGEFTVLASTALLETPSGPNLLVCLQDITDRKRAEAALRDREVRYRAVVEMSADGFLVTDLEGNILETNATYARLSGYSQEELVTMRVADLEAAETPEGVASHISQVVQNGSDLFETKHRAKDGTIWQVQISVTYWPFAGGRMLVFLRDIRRRSRSESLLRTRLKLSELAQAGNRRQLMQEALDEAELYTGSRIGFFHFVDDDQEHIVLQAWSTSTQNRFCQAEGQGLHYHIRQAGVWADCMRLRQPVIHNDYRTLPHRKALPIGHADVVRELVVPVIQGERVVAIFGVGNKSVDYVEEDLEVVQSIASMAMDFVARKRAEEAISLAQERLELAQKSAGAGFWEWDLRTNQLNWSPQLFGLFGLDPAHHRANMENFFGRIHADDLAKTRERKDGLQQITGPFSSEYRVCLPDGSTRWIEATGSTHFAEDGTPLKMSGICLDITERKKSEEQLRLSEERFRRLFDAMEEGCYLADAVFDVAGHCVDWRFLNVNAAYERLIGLTRDELIGHRMSAVLPPMDGHWRAAHVSVVSSGQPVRCEGSFLAAGGYYVANLFSPDCGQVAAIISDNTRLKADENRLAELQLQLHHTSRLATMGELAAGIAHDVNQPLCSIANFANACRNLASGEHADLQQIREWSEAIVTAAARAGDIIRRLLGYARRSQPDRRPSTMEQLLADALLLVQHEARANRVQIRFENDAPNQSIEVQAVPIQQVIVNLLRNSIDALQNSDKPERHVRVHADHSDGRLHVAVADNAAGLPTEMATRVFDPFFTTKPHGLGLGLAISRTIVEDHGGNIWATNNDEGGLTVHFTLPTK